MNSITKSSFCNHFRIRVITPHLLGGCSWTRIRNLHCLESFLIHCTPLPNRNATIATPWTVPWSARNVKPGRFAAAVFRLHRPLQPGISSASVPGLLRMFAAHSPHQVAWLVAEAQRRSFPKVLYVNLDDSLGKKDKRTSAQPVPRSNEPHHVIPGTTKPFAIWNVPCTLKRHGIASISATRPCGDSTAIVPPSSGCTFAASSAWRGRS